MKKSLMWFLLGTLLATVSLAMSARAQSNMQSNVVYACEFNQSPNRFGTINLSNAVFTLITNIGGTLINDLAYCPTNGVLYGILNSTTLVTFNETNGFMTSIANFSVSGIETLAFRYSDGSLFGATQSALYTIDPTTGVATLVGPFGSPPNLAANGQNIRFAQDGNLYVSITSTTTNTDIYRINTTNGVATWMGEAVGLPDLCLQNGGMNMFGVYVNLGNGYTQPIQLATFNLNSFVVGGTNADGSTHHITIVPVGAGTNFPPNFNFSGGNITPLPPVAIPWTYYRAKNTSLKISVTNLIAQSIIDPIGDSLGLVAVAGGLITNNTVIATTTNGSIVYIANPYAGSEYIVLAPTNNLNETFPFVVNDISFPELTASNMIIIIVTNAVSQLSGSISISSNTVTTTWAGIPGSSNVVQRSTDLSTWIDLWTTNAPAAGVFSFTDPSPPQPTAYYRLRQY
jgi:hypothetical protein